MISVTSRHVWCMTESHSAVARATLALEKITKGLSDLDPIEEPDGSASIPVPQRYKISELEPNTKGQDDISIVVGARELHSAGRHCK